MSTKRFAATTLAAVLALGAVCESGARATTRPVRSVTPANFTLRFAQDVQTVTGGDTATYTFDVVGSSSFRGAVVFDLPNLTDRFTGTITPETSTRLRLDINVPPFANTNSGVFILRGRSGSLTNQALFRLNVNARPVPTTTTPPPSATPPAQFILAPSTLTQVTAPGTGVQFGIAVNRIDGNNAPVAFRVDGLPAGTSANFAPNPTTQGTVLYVTPSTETKSGTYLLSIVGQAGSTAHSVAVQLVVRRDGDYNLSLAPTSALVPAGNDAVVAVNVGLKAGSLSPVPPDVTFAAFGLPAGATASFDPNPSNGLTTVRIRTLATVAAGKYKVTISGTSGRVTRSVALSLVVQSSVVGGFGLAATPTTATVVAGQETNYSLVIGATGGFNSGVNLAVKNLPPFALATVVQQSATAATIRVITSATTPAGLFPLLITGTAGTLSATVQVNLKVTSG